MAGVCATGRAVLAAEPAAVPEARHQLRNALGRAGVDRARQQEALLLVSELVANAVEHGSRRVDPIALVWTLDRDVLKIAVVDPAATDAAPVVLPPDGEREHGRGMLIIHRLANRWDQRRTAGRRQMSVRVRI